MKRLLNDRTTALWLATAAVSALFLAGLIALGIAQHRERIEALRLVDATLTELEHVRGQADDAAAKADAERDDLLARIEELTRQVEQLQDQVRDLGGTPAQPTSAEARDDEPPEPTATSDPTGPSERPQEPPEPPADPDPPAGPEPSPSPAPAPPRPDDPPDDDPELCVLDLCLDLDVSPTTAGRSHIPHPQGDRHAVRDHPRLAVPDRHRDNRAARRVRPHRR